MIKIKDGVDLKELEKFGFVKTNKYSYELPRFSGNLAGVMFVKWPDDTWQLLVDVVNNHRIDVSKRLDVIFDLIQAGLVEKYDQ